MGDVVVVVIGIDVVVVVIGVDGIVIVVVVIGVQVVSKGVGNLLTVASTAAWTRSDTSILNGEGSFMVGKAKLFPNQLYCVVTISIVSKSIVWNVNDENESI